MKTLVFAAVFAALSSPVLAETVIYIGGTEYGINEIANNTDTLSSEDLSALNAKDLGQAIQGTNSVEVTQNGGHGTTSSVFFRGTESDHTTFLLNGVRINDGITNSGRIEFINPLLIDELSIVKGSSSTLFGSSIGGVISADTSQITPEKLNGVTKVTVGSENHKEILIKKAVRNSNSALSLGIASTETNGIMPQPDSTKNAAYDSTSMDIAFHKNLALGHLKVQLSHNQGNAGYDDGTTPEHSDFKTTTGIISLKKIPHKLGELNAQLSHFILETTESTSNNSGSGFDFNNTYRTSLDIQNKTFLANKIKLNTGIIFTNEKIDVRSWNTYEGDFFNTEAFTQLQKTTEENDLKLGARLIKDQHHGDYTTWNAAFTQMLSEKLSVGISTSTGFKTPTGNERFNSGYGTIAIKPETSKTTELTTNYQFQDDSEITYSIYDTKIDNLINYATTAPYSFENAGNAEIKGHELLVKTSLKSIELKGIFSIKDPKDSNGNQLKKRAQKSASITATYNGGNYRAASQAIYSGNRTDVTSNGDGVMSSYTTINANLDYDLSENITLNTKIENLFDKDYETTDGYNTPGQSFYIGLKYTGF